MRHPVSWRFSFISLKLLSFSVSSHLMKKNLILSHLTKKNPVLFHFTEKKFDLISLKLLSSSVSSHFMKKNLILSHFTEKKSHFILILTQNRTESEQKILILAVSLHVISEKQSIALNTKCSDIMKIIKNWIFLFWYVYFMRTWKHNEQKRQNLLQINHYLYK